jgi:orotate phosphoribosyltransferase
MTTGRSSLGAVEALRAHGAEVVGVLALVNRSSDATALYEREGIPLLWVFTGEELLEAARG